MNDGTTYDARIYRIEVYKGSAVTTYRVRWKAGTKLWREGFRTAAQADSCRSALRTAARKGAADLRQVCDRPGRARQASHQRSAAAGLRWITLTILDLARNWHSDLHLAAPGGIQPHNRLAMQDHD
ncbi:MAG: hypothetical protein ACLQDY_23040 [Streptosporangiaceae bacterium]